MTKVLQYFSDFTNMSCETGADSQESKPQNQSIEIKDLPQKDVLNAFLHKHFALTALVSGCNGKWGFEDADGDGYTVFDGDCWDRVEGPEGFDISGSDIYPGAPDEPYDGLDSDCGGEDDFDADGDGYVPNEHQGKSTVGIDNPPFLPDGDCDDNEALVFPNATEVCDGLDNDCEGTIDNPGSVSDGPDVAVIEVYGDADGDSYGDLTSPLAVCEDSIPSGYSYFSNDCDDSDATVGQPGYWYVDDDNDGYGNNSAAPFEACDQPTGYVAWQGDCDDSDPLVNDGATEVCDTDNIDENCNGLADDADPYLDTTTTSVWWADADEDAYGTSTDVIASCDQPSGYLPEGGVEDCDDTERTTSPVGTEVCDGVDNDCNGTIDDNVFTGVTVYADEDGDGYGDASSAMDLDECDIPSGFVVDNTDCDDTNPSINPDTVWYADSDGDGYGDATRPQTQCAQPSGYVLDDQDCDDNDRNVNPTTIWYTDADSDGYGESSSAVNQCAQPSGAVLVDGDCDDANASINPGATEVCDTSNTDEDCSGQADDNDSGVDTTTQSTYYTDADGDGYGDASTAQDYCDQPSGTVTNSSDCDDANSAINPTTIWYADSDSDGYGDSSTSVTQCAEPSGYVLNDQDCDDANIDVNPGQTEVPFDALDNDCDGELPEWDGELNVSVDADAQLNGLGTNSQAGGDVEIVDDLNGDGFDDLVIGSPGDNTSASNAGAAFVVNGPITGVHGLGSADAVALGSSANEALGYRVTGGFDLTGDGIVDFLTSASGYNTFSGGIYLFAGPLSGTLSSPTAIVEGESLFHYLDDMTVADVNGDGQADLITAAELADNTASNTGSVYVTHGPISVDQSASDADVIWTGAATQDRLGVNVSNAGDVDGDGYDDFLVGASNESTRATNSGAVYLLMGSTTADSSVSGAWMSVYGGGSGDALSLGQVADVDGDGVLDAVYASSQTDNNGSNSGSVYIQYGPLSSGTYYADTDFDRVDGLAGEELGASLSVNGDVNGDGVHEILVGAPGSSSSYVLDGMTLTSGVLNSGIWLYGNSTGSLGTSVSTAGDVNNDGFDDILIGDSSHNSSTGSAYLIFGDQQ